MPGHFIMLWEHFEEGNLRGQIDFMKDRGMAFPEAKVWEWLG